MATPSLAIGATAAAQEEKKGKPADLFARAANVTTTVKKPHTPEQADLAKLTGRDVVCLCGTCPKRLITDCECGWATRNQNAILNAVVDGKTREQIVALYRQVYGDQVLAMLPNSGFAMTAWALPYAVGAISLVAALFVGLSFMRRREEPSGPEPSSPVAPEVTDDEDARAALAQELVDLD